MKRRKIIKARRSTIWRIHRQKREQYAGLLELFRREGLIDDQNRPTEEGKKALTDIEG